MAQPKSRLTLVARDAARPEADWVRVETAEYRLVFASSFSTLAYMLRYGMHEMHVDIERFVIDRVATHADVLELLAAIPEDFAGDVLAIFDDGSGFLSATGRNGGRILYSLSCRDVRFYLETNDLVTGRVTIERIA